MSAKLEDAELENVLQQIFVECDVSVLTSTLDSTVFTDDAVPISRIIEYIQDQLPTWSIDNLEELWECLIAVSTNDCVNLHQFKTATRHWITKMQQVQSTQHVDNSTREKLYLVSDTDSSMKTMDMTNEIVELELRNVKFRELLEENNVLRDELERHERSIDNLKQQHDIIQKQLKHYIQKCQHLEKENDEQRDQLNELIKKEKTMALALQRYTKEHQNLLKQLEAAEIEVQVIPSLKEKLEKITKEKMDCLRLITKMREEFDEKENNYSQLKTTITELEDTSINMKESYEYIIRNLREKNRLLTDENVELQSLSAFNTCSLEERLPISPVPDTNECLHSTPYKSLKVPVQDSLYMELKASGFTAECSRHDIQELEEELNEYDAAIFTILEQLEKVIQFFVTIRCSVDDLPHFNPPDKDTRSYNVNVLRHKASFLLNMVTEEITRRNTRRDSSTQLQAEPTNMTSSLNQFGVRSFQDLLSTYRSIHTLPSNLQLLQPSSLNVENSRRTFDYQNPETNTIDAPFARGDNLTQGNSDEKYTSPAAEARDVSNQEDPVCSEEKRSSEMPKVSSVLQVNSKSLTTSEEEKTDVSRSFQVPEVSSASNPPSPRRKISVYCRSFDVVTVQDHPKSNLEVRQSSVSNPDDSPAQIDKVTAWDRNTMASAKYAFNNVYRHEKSDSDSTNSTPGKQFQDSLLDDEPLVEQPILRKVHLAPTRFRFLQEARNELDRTEEASNCVSRISVNSTELDILNFSPSSIDGHEKDDASVHSSSFIDKCKKNVVESTSCLNKNVSQTHSMPNRRLFLHDQADSEKIVDSEDPHSQASVQRVDDESQSQIERSVDSQMSSRKDGSAVSGSDEREPATGSVDRFSIDEKVANEVGKAINVVSSTSLIDLISTKAVPSAQSDEKARERNLLETKREIRQLPLNTKKSYKRSYSEGENLSRLECHCKRKNALDPENIQVFPSLTDICLQESGIANLSDTELKIRENPSELELQKKYTAFSLCLCIDRLTLPQRIAMSVRQRDQSERNLSYEVRKMHQDIKELVLLCTDRESMERVERVKHQLNMIEQCAHMVSCAAETLGAVHQERRVSRAILLADKYLQVLQSRCEKLIANVAETKRVLVENNIVIEENSGELNDELPRIRCRSGISANNRMMIAKRRASVATMSRPMGNTQDVTKDTVRQRNSVSGRMTLRRPSFSSESPKWDIEKMDRAESSNSISELRGIFEQTESRRTSREENNNMLRLSHSTSQSTVNYAIIDNEVWTNVKEETSPEQLSDNESINSEDSARSHSFQLRRRKRRRILPIFHIMLSSILIFCIVFYMIQAMSLNICHEPLNKRLIGYVFDRYGQIRNAAPHPM